MVSMRQGQPAEMKRYCILPSVSVFGIGRGTGTLTKSHLQFVGAAAMHLPEKDMLHPCGALLVVYSKVFAKYSQGTSRYSTTARGECFSTSVYTVMTARFTSMFHYTKLPRSERSRLK